MLAGRYLVPLRLGLRALRRDWRAGELRLLATALVVAVASVGTVGLFKERVNRGLLSQASELLAADVIVTSPDPIADTLEASALHFGLASARTLGFRSMISAGERLQLVELKAVGPGYPLRGRLRIAQGPDMAGQVAPGIPAPGTVWLEPRLLAMLNMKAGATLQLGSSQFRISARLLDEPDRAGDLFSIAPRLMMRLSDVPATGLVTRGSRVKHRLLLAGDQQALEAFRNAEESTLPAGTRLRTLRDTRPGLRSTLDKGMRFLDLGALISVCLAAIAIYVTARRYSQRHLNTAALLRCLGASRNDVLLILGVQLLFIGVLAASSGGALAWISQEMLARFYGGLLAPVLPEPSLQALLFAWLIGVVTLAACALPPLIRLRTIPPARVLNRNLRGTGGAGRLTWLGATALLMMLFFAQEGDLHLTAYVLAGTVATLGLLALTGLLLMRLLGPLRHRGGVAWRFGLANLSRHSGANIVQMVAFGGGLMLLLLLAFARDDLTHAWREGLPPGTPNYFLINIQPDEVKTLEAFLHRQGLEKPVLYPMVRARLSSHNGQSVQPHTYTDKRAQRLALREFNLSWSRELPPDNVLSGGRWWSGNTPAAPGVFSVEQGLADTLGIGLGDHLEFTVAGRPVTGTVANLRALEWGSFRVNFFVLTPPGMLEGFPATWISSFHLNPAQKSMLPALIQAFPSVTVVEVDALLNRAQALMGQAARGVEFLFFFTLLAGCCVILATIQASQDERRRECAILRTLGASRRRVRQGLLVEFLVLGLLAGTSAAAGATLLEGLLAREVFDIAYAPNPWLWLVGIAGGAGVIGILGLLGTRGVLSQPPLGTLRAGGS